MHSIWDVCETKRNHYLCLRKYLVHFWQYHWRDLRHLIISNFPAKLWNKMYQQLYTWFLLWILDVMDLLSKVHNGYAIGKCQTCENSHGTVHCVAVVARERFHQNAEQFRPCLRPIPVRYSRYSVSHTGPHFTDGLLQSMWKNVSNGRFCLKSKARHNCQETSLRRKRTWTQFWTCRNQDTSLTASAVSGGRYLSECCDQWASTYCFRRTEANWRIARAPSGSTVSSARWTPNSTR